MKHLLNTSLLHTVLVIAVLITATDSFAQFGGGGGGGMYGGRGSRGGSNESYSQRNSRPESPVSTPDPGSVQQIEYRLALFEDDLKLKPEQKQIWQAFANKVRAYAADVAREKSQTTSINSNQPLGIGHIHSVVDGARNRLTALEDIESITVTLYKTLSPEQTSLMDRRLPTVVAPKPLSLSGSGNSGDMLPELGDRRR